MARDIVLDLLANGDFKWECEEIGNEEEPCQETSA